MGEEALLELANQVLKSSKGAQLLGEGLNIGELKDRISFLASQYQIDLTTLEEATVDKINEAIDDPSNLTREQRRERRQQRRLSRRERIEKLKQDTLEGVEDIKQKIRAEIQELKEKIKSEIPVLQEFTITGRIQDVIDNTPIKGVKVQLGVNPNVGDGNTPSEELASELDKEGVLNFDPELLPGDIEFDPNEFVYVPVVGSGNVRTDAQGNYSIKIKIPIIPKNQKSLLPIALLFSKGGYLPGTKVILNGDQTIKTDVSLSDLINIESASKQIKQGYVDKIDEAQRLVQAFAQSLPEQAISAKKLAIHRITDALKTKLLPLVIGLLFSFGISKITQANRKTCPPNLLDVTRTRNRVVRQLNQLFKAIVSNTALAAAFIALAATLKGVRLATDAIPAPQAIGTPPSKDFGGLISALPYSFTGKMQRLKDTLAELEEQNTNLNRAILSNLVFLIAGVTTVVILLKAIDDMSQQCAQEDGATDLQLTAINQELLDLAEEEEEDGNPIIGNVNGFTFSVETDNKNPVGTLKRRFAVAKDSRGITVLKGEPSFSSSDQILIDELVFYIQQNDLKAF